MNTAINYSVTAENTQGKALRRIRRFFPLAYQKLILLNWSWREVGIGNYGATDGRNLFLNPEGLKKINSTSDPVGYLAFLLIHEALHALLNHALRLAGLKDHALANEAADYVINAIIARINAKVKEEEGFIPFPFIDGILHDEEISYATDGKSLSAEQVYQNLFKDAPTQPQPEQGEEGEEGEDGETGEGQDSSDEDGESEGEQQSRSSGDEDEDESEEQGKSNTGAPLSDEEILGDFVGTGVSDLTEPELTDEETEDDVEQEIEIENEILDIEAKANASCGVGGSQGTVDVANAHRSRDGVVNFEDVLTDLLRTSYDEGWGKPFNNQLYQGSGIVAHGRGSKVAGEIAFLVDLSGSNYHEAGDMISRTEDAFDAVNPEIIHVVGFDWKVTEHIEVSGGQPLPKEIKGGGGTDIAAALNWVEENLSNLDAIIVLTDGYDNWSKIEKAEPSLPVVWLNYGDDRWLQPNAYSFGERIDVNYL